MASLPAFLSLSLSLSLYFSLSLNLFVFDQSNEYFDQFYLSFVFVLELISIDFNGMSTRLDNHIHCSLIFMLFVLMFLITFFGHS